MTSRRRRPPSPAELRDRQSTRRGYLAIAGAVVFIAGSVGLFAAARTATPGLGTDLCPLSSEPVAEVVVLLDATDAWNPIQRAVIQTEFARMQASLPRFSRVQLFALEPMEQPLIEPVLRLCNPGTIDDYSSVPLIASLKARFFGNPDLIGRWRDEFVVALDSVLGAVAEGPGAGQSPIMETVRGIAIGAFSDAGTDQRSLYIFSDMLQHSSSYSHYTSASWVRDDAVRLAGLSAAGTAALEGVEVEIFLLNREIPGGEGPGALTEFWDAWFSRQGARIERVRRIEG